MKLLLLILIAVIGATPAIGQTNNRDATHARIASLKSELRNLETSLLPPAPSDTEPYSEFLGKGISGVIRLMPRQSFEKAAIVSINGGGAYYSFKRLTHEYGQGSDITLEQENFGVGFAGADYGWIGAVDADFDEITLEHPVIHFLTAYKVPTKEPDARAEYRRTWNGVTGGGVTFKSRVKATAATTYVLRSISYDRSDMLVCFRTLRKDTDGSWILVWKLLKEFDKPELERTPQVN